MYKLAYPEESDMNEIATKRGKRLYKYIREGRLPQAFEYRVMVIIPKDSIGGVRGIGLLESIYKLISQVINLKMAESI